MHYDFDQIIDRSRNHSAKYDERKKKFGTDDVIPLWIADMDFKTAQPIIDALTARAQEGIWGYTARPESYFEAIRGWQKRRNGWDIDPKLMSFSLGVVQTISACVKLFTPEGGSVLIQTPVYSEFYDMAEAWNRKVLENRFLEHDGKWSVDWADFEEKLQQADLFLLCSPHNPLGIVWEEAELRRMMELCLKHHVLVMSDEIHSDLIFHGKKHIPTATLSPEIAANVVTGISGTKTFNLAGLQASNIIIQNEELRNKFKQLLNNLHIGGCNVFVDSVVIAAYTQCDQWLDELNAYIKSNMDYFSEQVNAIAPLKMWNPEGTYLAWVDCRGLNMTDEQLSAFFKEHHMMFNGGTFFGPEGSGFTRVNLACPRCYVEEAVKRLKAAVASLSK